MLERCLCRAPSPLNARATTSVVLDVVLLSLALTVEVPHLHDMDNGGTITHVHAWGAQGHFHSSNLGFCEGAPCGPYPLHYVHTHIGDLSW